MTISFLRYKCVCVAFPTQMGMGKCMENTVNPYINAFFTLYVCVYVLCKWRLSQSDMSGRRKLSIHCIGGRLVGESEHDAAWFGYVFMYMFVYILRYVYAYVNSMYFVGLIQELYAHTVTFGSVFFLLVYIDFRRWVRTYQLPSSFLGGHGDFHTLAYTWQFPLVCVCMCGFFSNVSHARFQIM